MPQRSKYTDKQFEAAMNDIIVALEKNKADRDLSLMVLGNVITQIFQHQFTPENRVKGVQKFTEVLNKSVK
jgi:hypothetical protein